MEEAVLLVKIMSGEDRRHYSLVVEDEEKVSSAHMIGKVSAAHVVDVEPQHAQPPLARAGMAMARHAPMAVTDLEELERLTGVEVAQARQAVVWMQLESPNELSKVDPKQRPGWYSRAPHVKQAPVYYRRDWCEGYAGSGAAYALGYQEWPALDLGEVSLRIKRWQLEETGRRVAEALAGKGPNLDVFMREVYFPSQEPTCDVREQCRMLFGLNYSVHAARFVREAYANFIHEQKLALFDYAEGRSHQETR